MTVLPYRDYTYVRLISARTGETLVEIKMLDGAIVIWGACCRPSEFTASLAASAASVSVQSSLTASRSVEDVRSFFRPLR